MSEINEFIVNYITMFENNNMDINEVECISDRIKRIDNNYSSYNLLEEVDVIESNKWKFLLKGIIAEFYTSVIEAISYYEKAIQYGNTIALWQLARLYDTGEFIKEDNMKAFIFYYKYYEKIDDLENFLENTNSLKNPDFIKIFIDSHTEVIEHKAKNKKLKKHNKKLKRKIAKLEYAPNGVGYHKSKDHFEILCDRSTK